MQHRPKMWIIVLIGLFLLAFEIGFQPIRWIRSGGSQGTAIFEYDLGKDAAEASDDLEAKGEELKAKVVTAEGGLNEEHVKDFRLVSPSKLRVETVVLDDQQKALDRETVLAALREEFEEIAAVEVAPDVLDEEPLARLGPIGVFRPAPHVRLGLDLQGGAHVVLQCMPSTMMTFATPESWPMATAEGGEPEVEDADPEEAATDEASTEESDAETPEAEEATEEGAEEADEPAEIVRPAEGWEPGETRESLKAALTKLLNDMGADDAEVSVVSDSRVVITTQAPDRRAADAQHTAVLKWLGERYAGVPAFQYALGKDAADNDEELEAKLAELRARVTAAGVAQDRIGQFEFMSPTQILVITDASTPEQLEADRQAIAGVLAEDYSKLKPLPPIIASEPSSVFVNEEEDTADKTKHIIDLRLYSMGDVKEPIVQKQGDDRIIVELPGVKDPDRVTDILGKTAQLEFRLVPERYSPGTLRGDEPDYKNWEDSQGAGAVQEEAVLAESPVMFSGRDLKAKSVVKPGQQGDYEVTFELREERRIDFAEFTRENVGRIMSIVLDRETQMAPVIRSQIDGAGVISGDMTAEDAGDLKLLLNAGALPVPLEIVENRQVSATLGADSIRKSMVAGLIGLCCVAVFMVLYYRLPGMLANIALALYILLMIGLLSTWSPLEATLTLPGIAGIILSIGMAVDANIIIFERLKEELRARTTARAAAEAGFNRAWTAILDANVTTLMVAAALYFLGTSAIKSFAVTLFLGVAVSLFTAMYPSRWLVFMAARSRLGEKRWWFGVGAAPSSAPDAAGGSE